MFVRIIFVIFMVPVWSIIPNQPTAAPTATAGPSILPTFRPTMMPTTKPTVLPTTQKPTVIPTTSVPSEFPSFRPTVTPTTIKPTQIPTTITPTQSPTQKPTALPTFSPTFRPTSMPSSMPSDQPSCQPSSNPTQPTGQPTSNPSQPSSQPSNQPSNQPTGAPSTVPDCPSGTYYEFTGDGTYVCIPCPAGQFSTAKSHTCSVCPVGTYSPSNATAGECLLCPVDFYSSSLGALQCDACPTGEITGGLGATSSSDCVNPFSNFIMGFVALFFSIIALSFYICGGRLRRIAFLRKERLVKPSQKMYNITYEQINEVSEVCNSIVVEENARRKADPSFQTTSWERFKIWFKPILFYILAFLTVVIGTLYFFLYSLSHVFFTALILWRGYRFHFSFYDRISEYVGHISFSLHMPFLNNLAYPFLYVLNLLADFNINLSYVTVSCAGAQAPIRLLLDCVVMGVVVIIIESDMEIFWATAFSKTHNKFKALLFNRYYLTQGGSTAVYYFLWSCCLSLMPHPRKALQYALGLVAVNLFFVDGGVGDHSNNCNSTVRLPFDTILAWLSSIVAYLLFPPAVYLLSQILVPSFKLPDHDGKPPFIARKIVDKDGKRVNGACSSCTSCLSRMMKLFAILSSLDWFYVKTVFIFAIRLYKSMQGFVENKLSKKRPESVQLKSFKLFRSNSTTGSARDDASVRSMSVDSTVSGYQMQHKQSVDSTADKSDPNTTHDGEELPFVPWFHAVNTIATFALSDKERSAKNKANREREDQLWHSVVNEFPSYFRMVRTAAEDMQSAFIIEVESGCCSRAGMMGCFTNMVISLLIRIGKWMLPVQLICSPRARRIWLRVLENYGVFMKISLGWWTAKEIANYNLLEKLAEFEEIEQSATAIERRSMGGTVTAEAAEAEDDLSGESMKLQWLNLFSAMVSVRVVLIQLVPVLTILSTLAVDISSSPILVWSEELRAKLPAMIIRNPYEKAKARLKADYSKSGAAPSDWKVHVVSLNILFNESRLIQFLLNVYMNLYAISIVFSDGIGRRATILFIIIFLALSFIRSLYPLLLLHKLMFPYGGMGKVVSEVGSAAMDVGDAAVTSGKAVYVAGKDVESGLQLAGGAVSSGANTAGAAVAHAVEEDGVSNPLNAVHLSSSTKGEASVAIDAVKNEANVSKSLNRISKLFSKHKPKSDPAVTAAASTATGSVVDQAASSAVKSSAEAGAEAAGSDVVNAAGQSSGSSRSGSSVQVTTRDNGHDSV